jgi:hypothetical protein
MSENTAQTTPATATATPTKEPTPKRRHRCPKCVVCRRTVRSFAYVGYEDQALCNVCRDGYSPE